MNNRQKALLRILLTESGEHHLVQKLAERLDCSEKTVRSDLKMIEEYLQEHSDAKIIRKPGYGVYIEIDEHENTRIFSTLQLADFQEKSEKDHDRLIQTAYHLLMNIKPVTVTELSNRYYVNKAVIKKDLIQLEEWLKKFNLDLITKQKVGLNVEGREKDKRLALARLSEFLQQPEPRISFIKTQFSSYELDLVQKELKELQQRHSLFFTDEAFEGLVVHVLLITKRTKLKQFITISKQEASNLKDKREYEWAAEFLKKLEPHFAMHFPEEEIIYLALHFLGGKVRYHLPGEVKETGLSENNPYLDKVMDQLSVKMSQICLVDFQKDKVLMNGLKIHLNTALNRLEYGLSVSNPMLNEIKKLYPYMFDMVIHSLEEIHQSTSLNIPEEEAGYITLHFQASIERLKDQRGKEKNTVIVCHMGVGMSQLLRTKIEQRFHPVHVLGCIGRADLEPFLEKSNVDLVISTISLPELKVPHIVVSPLLAASDEKRLEDFIKQLDHPMKKGNAESILLKYTTPFLVFLQEEATNKYELIEKMGNTLFQKGYVDKEYSLNAVIRERMSATTIGSGIAIPHGHPGLIKHSAIAVAALKEPLEWGAEKVSLVFLLAVKNDRQEETRQLFRELSYLSSQPVFIQSMIKETDILTFLSNYKDLINQGE